MFIDLKLLGSEIMGQLYIYIISYLQWTKVVTEYNGAKNDDFLRGCIHHRIIHCKSATHLICMGLCFPILCRDW